MMSPYCITFSLLITLLLVLAIIFKRSGDGKTAERLVFGVSMFAGVSVHELINWMEWYYRSGLTMTVVLVVMFVLMYLLRFVKEKNS